MFNSKTNEWEDWYDDEGRDIDEILFEIKSEDESEEDEDQKILKINREELSKRKRQS